MIKLKSNEKQIVSTKMLLKLFELTEEELIWYINATRYQLANPGVLDLEFMGREIRCYYAEKEPVEAHFKPVKKGEDSCSMLVALDYERIVLFAFVGDYNYEIWLGYVQVGESYEFFEEYFRAYMFCSRRKYGF